MKPKPFLLPKEVLDRLGECTAAYLLISTDGRGNIEFKMDHGNDLLIKLGLLQFAAMQIDLLTEAVREEMAQLANPLDDGAED